MKHLTLTLLFTATFGLTSGFSMESQKDKNQYLDDAQTMMDSHEMVIEENFTDPNGKDREAKKKYRRFDSRKYQLGALVNDIKKLQQTPKKELTEKLFKELKDKLGNACNEVARSSGINYDFYYGKSDVDSMMLGYRVNHKTKDVGGWRKHLEEYLNIDKINPSGSEDLDFVMTSIRAKLHKNKNLYVHGGWGTGSSTIYYKRSTEFMNEFGSLPEFNNWDRNNLLPVGFWQVYTSAANPRASDIKALFTHSIPNYQLLSQSFFKTLDVSQDAEKLKESIGYFLFLWSHAEIYLGQEYVGEWLIQAIAESHGFNLVFEKDWQGKKNGTMAPYMYALTYLDVEEFLEKFMNNAKLVKIN